MSALSTPLAQRIPEPYLALNPDDASMLEVSEGEPIELEALPDMGNRVLAVKLSADLPVGVAGIPVGLPGLPGAAF